MRMSSLKNLFVPFLRHRHLGRHFQRLILFESLMHTTVSRNMPPEQAQILVSIARHTPETVFAQLNSDPGGLSETQAEAMRAQSGFNEIEHEKPLPWWAHLWHCYCNPFSLLLTLLAVISCITGDLTATVVISIMVALATLLRFWQEVKSNKAADELKSMVSNTTSVIRKHDDDSGVLTSSRYEIPIRLLVPGDMIRLSAGDMIPADCRVLAARDLFVAQAAMTGESMPVEKAVQLHDASTMNPLELDNILFMGTNIVSGSATAIVIHTGNRTYFGALASRVVAEDRAPTSFQTGVNRVSWLLIRFMFVMAPLVLLINGFTKHDWLDAFLFALSIAVGLTPEMLPMIVTSTLAKGAVFLSRKKVIVKRLGAIQNFGAMDILCTDKTGTLTQDKIFLSHHVDVWGKMSDEVLELTYLNSYYETGLKNLLDVAVLEQKVNAQENFSKVDEIPFDFTRRRMSVVVAKEAAQHLLITKGAVDEILACCSTLKDQNGITELTPELLSRVREVTAHFNADGYRVVAVAVKTFPGEKEQYSIADESGLTLMGYVAFLDPPKESTAPALQALAAHGISVKVLTGDNELVTEKVCRDVGLPMHGVLLGGDIEGMDDETLARAIESQNIFARLTPLHKERIVAMYKRNGHVVGFMGDGINDASALRAADIGISVDTGVDIAKEAADIILLENSLMVLEEGVQEGRRTFANMLKYIKMTASSNFGNVFSVLIASAFLPFLPMLPLQLLVQNLLYDISQTAIPFDNVDSDLIQKPQRWQPADIGRFMLFFGPISSIFDVLTFAMMWFVFGAGSPEKQALFQSGWFVVGLLTQTLIVHMIRTPKIPFIQSRPAWPLMAATIIIMGTGIFLPMGPLAEYFRMEALPPLYFALLPLILLGYMVLTQLMKKWYQHYWGWQ
ncbi:magnesium-translocating P-type ATPase [Oxalobacter vibrioformis]|uniref:Magnesium-transporting ATPase, P-type 1 n=1 Tax=Oxalobacter vibrioformis TaxID=933080 RepID=A0A9E9LZG2_9BURK|nr:magnesium-translocating P-type ATPase [Oxalobacter vibrioformis]WAW11306.1 magnesium-translocating P-type ATPase [Oxalobacter vibrioformis]